MSIFHNIGPLNTTRNMHVCLDSLAKQSVHSAYAHFWYCLTRLHVHAMFPSFQIQKKAKVLNWTKKKSEDATIEGRIGVDKGVAQ